ncbi:hypothetical protein [Streptomyces sp. NPDC056291]|uniref:hypothetical protein n=1 Tax=unclassified Streptomyces TaxID=2593676 RepID=UPI0035E3138E
MTSKLFVATAGCCSTILLLIPGYSSDGNGGNGIADKSPKEIRHQAYQALLSAKSVRMTLKDAR